MEVDPEGATGVAKFKLALVKHYGDIQTAWRQGLDLNLSGRVEEAEITECIQRLGLKLDGKEVFRSLLPDSPRSKTLGLTLAEFDPETWKALASGEKSMRKITTDFKDALDTNQDEDQTSRAETALKEIVDLCEGRYGSLVSAWRNCFDSDRNG